MNRPRNNRGQYISTGKKPLDILAGVTDSSFGIQSTNNSVAPKAIQNFSQALTPIEAYELSSAVRSAIRARNEPIRQIEIRLFTKDGREITDGDVVKFW